MVVDLFLVYQFIKRLATPFKEWEAYKLGIIDEDGNQLKKRRELRTVKERDAWGKFDVLVSKLKKLLEKIPGGKSRIASYAAALWLIKENEYIEQHGDILTEEHIYEKLQEYISLVEETQNKSVDKLFEEIMDEEGIANAAGSGAVAGIGVGDDGEPGFTKSAMRRYKNKKDKLAKRRRII